MFYVKNLLIIPQKTGIVFRIDRHRAGLTRVFPFSDDGSDVGCTQIKYP